MSIAIAVAFYIMKKYLFYIFFGFIFNNLNGQVSSGRIEYSLSLEDDDNLSKGELADFFKEAQQNAVHIKFILDFNNEEMIFYSLNPEIDGITTAFSLAFAGVDGVYYRKKNEKIVLNAIEHPVVGKVIIKEDYNIDWQLSEESKMIEGFLCYKAHTTIKYNNGVGDFVKQLIVWYCPQIPHSFGPKGYGNLPGMILEFQDNNILIGAKKITFNKEELKIA